MSTSPQPSQPDLADQLPAEAYHHLVHTLRLTLPPPPGGSPQDLLRRDRAAIARVAALVPANAAEADMAAQFVAASEQWKECLRLAQLPETTPEWAHKCRAQANSMMRQANAALRLLLRLQAAREKRDADQVTRDRAAWTEHCALSLMAEALSHAPPPPAPPAAPTPIAEPAPAPDTRPRRTPAEGLDPDLIAAAERYAATWPERAAQIRRTGKLPSDVRYFEPSEARVARALIDADTPALVALDSAFPAPRAT